MNYIKITKHDIANGTGVRVVLWVSGCSCYCKGCHNPQTWDKQAGQTFTADTMQEIMKALDHSYIAGLTLSGGHPLESYNINTISTIVKTVKKHFLDKTIWLYTGYLFENIIKNDKIRNGILPYVDVVVDGGFEIENKDISLDWCGSTNQRVIDVKSTLCNGKIILFRR